MGQFKKGKSDTVVIGGGHSLMLGHMPLSIPTEAYPQLNFGKTAIAQLGLFSSPDYNTFYPGVTREDFTPKDADFIEPVYRLLSEVIVNKAWNPVDFSQGGVLKASTPMLVGQTVNCDHSTDVANAIGSVKETFWQEAYKDSGVLVPAGISGVLKIDAKANPRLARGILMDPPSIHSNSVSVKFAWDKSHPKMSDQDFWSKLGTFTEKGELIRRVVVDIECYFETSLVSHGADPFAQKVNDKGEINNPKWASKQNYAAEKGSEVEYYFMNWKSRKLDVINNTTVFNLKDNTSNHKNLDHMDEQEILRLLMGAGLIELAEGKEVTVENVKEAIQLAMAENTSLSSQVASLKLEKTELETKVSELSNKVNELTTAEESNKGMVQLGTKYLTDSREATVALYKKVVGGEDKADEAIVELINSSALNQVLALNKTYQAQLEQKYPFHCLDCGSQNVNRSSSQTSEEEEEGTENKNTSTQGFSNIMSKLVSNKNKGSIFKTTE